MGRRERRQKHFEEQKQKAKPNRKLGAEKIVYAILAVFLICFSIFGLLQNNLIEEKELTTINATLAQAPEFITYKIKSSTYNDIIIKVNESKNTFRISSATYKATNHKTVKDLLQTGEKVELKMFKKDIAELSDTDNKIEVYGLVKGGYNFIDLEKRKKILDKDAKWCYLLIVIGIVFLYYGLNKQKSNRDIDTALLAAIIIGIVLMYLFFL